MRTCRHFHLGSEKTNFNLVCACPCVSVPVYLYHRELVRIRGQACMSTLTLRLFGNGNSCRWPLYDQQDSCKIPEILLPRLSISGITDKHYYTWLYMHSGDLSQALTLVWEALSTAPDRNLFLCMERRQWGGGSQAQGQQICRVQSPFWGRSRLETGTISPQDSTFWSLLRWVKVCVEARKETRSHCGGPESKKLPAPEPS